MSKSNFSLASWQEKKRDAADNRQQERTLVEDWEATLFTDAVPPPEYCSG